MYLNLRVYDRSGGFKELKLTDLSKNMSVAALQARIQSETGIEVGHQQLIYKGKIMSGGDGATLLHYNVNYNETIQVSKRVPLGEISTNNDSNMESKEVEPEKEKVVAPVLEEAESLLYQIQDLVDVKDIDEASDTIGAFFEAKINRITQNPDGVPGSDGLCYHITYDKYPNDDTDYKFSNLTLRPRARHVLPLSDLKAGDTALVNYNARDGEKVGEWYEAEVTAVNARRKELTCTVYIGKERTPLPDCQILSSGAQIFRLENPIPLSDRTPSLQKELDGAVERIHTIECQDCGDRAEKKCKQCGCNKCGKKNNPETLIICDECQLSFHLKCIGLPEMPPDDEEYFCAGCKREDTTIKPGDKLINKKLKNAPSQTKKQTRDWGKGFACAGRTKVNDKVDKGFKGQIPGTEVGMTWLYRIQLSEMGIHRPPVSGIHANKDLGAMSICLNGGYEDDVDNGEEFYYTGSGGRDLDGNKRTNVQSFDQKLEKMNLGLAMNCDCPVSEKGGVAKNWRKGAPIRVVRGSKMYKKHPQYLPKEGFRYDGIYKVIKYYKERGQSGFYVWKYLMRRDDENAAPWTKEGQKIIADRGWTVICPEGYVPKEPKVGKGKRKRTDSDAGKENDEPKAPSSVAKKAKKKFSIPGPLRTLISADEHNQKSWVELLKTEFSSLEELREQIRERFKCSICMTVVTVPVKLVCTHDMCQECLDNFSKQEDLSKVCPMCRSDFKGDEAENKELRKVLNYVFPAYEST